jgi:histidinol-phosphate aminotransferase
MIRNGADYGYPDWLRITIGTYEENQKVVKVFQEILAQRD